MAKKELTRELDDVVHDLVELRQEMGKRIVIIAESAKPAATGLAIVAGLSAAIALLKKVLSLWWGYKLIFFISISAASYRYLQKCHDRFDEHQARGVSYG